MFPLDDQYGIWPVKVVYTFLLNEDSGCGKQHHEFLCWEWMVVEMNLREYSLAMCVCESDPTSSLPKLTLDEL